MAAGGKWDEDDSIDDDTGSDAGELSRIGSEGSEGSAGVAAAGGAGGGYDDGSEMDDGFDADGMGPLESEDSGF